MSLPDIERNTIKALARAWFLHGCANLERVAQLPTIADLERGTMPVIVVGAGPSLTRELPTLRDVAGNAIILCASHALIPLVAAGVIPDAVVILDPSESMLTHFNGVDMARIAIIAAPNVAPAILNCPLPTIVYFPPGPGELWIARATGASTSAVISTGGNVAGAALSIALRMTSGPIALVGIDCGFPREKTYAAGVSHAEEHARVYASCPIEVPSQGGDLIRSTEALDQARLYLSDLATANAGRISNASLGGADIPGTDVVPLAAWCRVHVDPEGPRRIGIPWQSIATDRRPGMVAYMLSAAASMDAATGRLDALALESQDAGRAAQREIVELLGDAADLVQLYVLTVDREIEPERIYAAMAGACRALAPTIRERFATPA